MLQPPTIIWPGLSVFQYTYWVYPRGSRFRPGQPGNYIYAVEKLPDQLTPLYIGETTDLNQRLLDHDCEFSLFRATHVCVHVNPFGEESRKSEEQDLIGRWQPACNTRHNSEPGEIKRTSTITTEEPSEIRERRRSHCPPY